MFLIYFSWAELSHKENSSHLQPVLVSSFPAATNEVNSQRKSLGISYSLWTTRFEESTFKLLNSFSLLVWSSGILSSQVLILHAMLPAALQRDLIPYNPILWFLYSSCFSLWAWDWDIPVIPVPPLSCAPGAGFASCLLHQPQSFCWETAKQGGSSQFYVFLTLRQKHHYRPSVLLC